MDLPGRFFGLIGLASSGKHPNSPFVALSMRRHLCAEPLQAMVHELLGMHNNIVDLKKATARDGQEV